MPIAAVPSYLGEDFSEMPPGHRFGPFFPVWGQQDWCMPKDGAKTTALKAVLNFPQCKEQIEALRGRQGAVAATLGSRLLTVDAVSISPFVTGTGLDHPLENGFAFLNPYGLPYLPGSAVKGLLRQCARLLVAGEFGDDNEDWDEDAIEALFGREEAADGEAPADQGGRGALLFWDVLIAPKNYTLSIDVLTPHYGDYYRGDETPHDSGAPNPVPFLVVPPGADFTFHVQCNLALINSQDTRALWQDMVQQLLQQAFDWLGFGAKTAGGYGQLQLDISALQERKEQAQAAARAAQPEEKRQIEMVRDMLGNRAAAGSGPGSQDYAGKVAQIVGAAAQWSAADRAELAQVAEKALEYFGINLKKKNKKTKISWKDRLRALQEPQ